jgi:hypothetical protein
MKIIIQQKIHASVSTDSMKKMYRVNNSPNQSTRAAHGEEDVPGTVHTIQQDPKMIHLHPYINSTYTLYVLYIQCSVSGLVKRACNIGGSPKFEFTFSAMCISQNVNGHYIYCVINFEFFSGFL